MFILEREVYPAGSAMKPCKVYRSDKKAETYLYLADDLEFDDLPAELREQFGEPAFVLSLELSAERKLARVDTKKVLESLEEQGFYLQLPPKLPIEEEITRSLLRTGRNTD
jgi:uncharacterized protein YcgL (UPF0745 family)